LIYILSILSVTVGYASVCSFVHTLRHPIHLFGFTDQYRTNLSSLYSLTNVGVKVNERYACMYNMYSN